MNDNVRPLTPQEMKDNLNKDIQACTVREEEKRLRLLNALTAEKLKNQAEAAGTWIYDPNTKTWYTPQEFYDSFKLYFNDNPFFHRVKLKHPNEGVRAGFKQLADLQERLTLFTQKIINYYGDK